MLDGGIDSYNVLIPHSDCSGGDSESILKIIMLIVSFFFDSQIFTYTQFSVLRTLQ